MINEDCALKLKVRDRDIIGSITQGIPMVVEKFGKKQFCQHTKVLRYLVLRSLKN